MNTKEFTVECLAWGCGQWPEVATDAQSAAEQFAVTAWDNGEVEDVETVRVVVVSPDGLVSNWNVTGDRDGGKATVVDESDTISCATEWHEHLKL